MAEFVEIEQLINRYFNALDRRDHAALLDCLTEDVDWRMRGDRIGRAQVAQALAERPDNFMVRHLITNLEIRDASAFFLLVVIGVFSEQRQTAPYSLVPPNHVHGPVIADCNAQFRDTSEGLKMSRLTGSVVFNSSAS